MKIKTRITKEEYNKQGELIKKTIEDEFYSDELSDEELMKSIAPLTQKDNPAQPMIVSMYGISPTTYY